MGKLERINLDLQKCVLMKELGFNNKKIKNYMNKETLEHIEELRQKGIIKSQF